MQEDVRREPAGPVFGHLVRFIVVFSGAATLATRSRDQGATVIAWPQQAEQRDLLRAPRDTPVAFAELRGLR